MPDRLLDGEGSALAIQIAHALAHSYILVSLDGGGLVAGGFESGVQISAPAEDEEFAAYIANALADIGKLKDVVVNGERHSGTNVAQGVTMTGVVMSGGTSIMPAAPLPKGSPVEIMVGIRPVEVIVANVK